MQMEHWEVSTMSLTSSAPRLVHIPIHLKYFVPLLIVGIHQFLQDFNVFSNMPSEPAFGPLEHTCFEAEQCLIQAMLKELLECFIK